jgi:hypothetical protein
MISYIKKESDDLKSEDLMIRKIRNDINYQQNSDNIKKLVTNTLECQKTIININERNPPYNIKHTPHDILVHAIEKSINVNLLKIGKIMVDILKTEMPLTYEEKTMGSL